MIQLSEILGENKDFPKENEIEEIDGYKELMNSISGKAYLRYSAGPFYDKKMGGKSKDHLRGTEHDGISSVPISESQLRNFPADSLEILTDYIDLYDMPDRFPWVFYGNPEGMDSDGMVTVDIDSVEVIGKLSDDFVERLKDWESDYDYLEWPPPNPKNYGIEMPENDLWEEQE